MIEEFVGEADTGRHVRPFRALSMFALAIQIEEFEVAGVQVKAWSVAEDGCADRLVYTSAHGWVGNRAKQAQEVS